MRKRHQDLQPWLDYFKMLQTYEDKGYLEVKPEKHEAYITRAALLTLVPEALPDGPTLPQDKVVSGTTPIIGALQRIRAYAGWKSQQGGGYPKRPFALHAVSEDEPHDLLSTVLLTRRRVWWKPWSTAEHIEVITY